MSVTIKTNNKPRPILYGYELTTKEKQEFDYLDDIESASFVRYKGQVRDLGEFLIITKNMPFCNNGWQGYSSDSFFSGVVIKYAPDDNETVIVGRYYS